MQRGVSGFVWIAGGLLLALGTGVAKAQSVLGEPTNPARTFSTNCAMCHRSPQGLVKDERSLQGFLIQHYTTGPQMSSAMAAYLAAAGRGAPSREGSPKGQREAAPREARAPQPEEGAPKGAPKRTDADPAQRKQAARTPQPSAKRGQHDHAPAIDVVPEPPAATADKPETVRLAEPPSEAPRQQAAAAGVAGAAPQEAGAQGAAPAAARNPDQPSFSSPLP